MNKLSSLFVLICLGLQTASAQGLQDKNLNPAEIPGRTPIPKLLPGHTDQERWGLVTKNAPKLIGMKQSQVTSLFRVPTFFWGKSPLSYLTTQNCTNLSR